MIQPLRLATLPAPAPASRAAVPSEAEAAAVIDTYLHDASGDRMRMGGVSAGVQLGMGVLATAAGCLAGTPGIAVATVAAAGVGIALGLHNARRYMETTSGGDRFMSAYLSCFLNGFQSVISGAAAMSAGPVPGLLAALGGATVGGIVSGAWRGSQSVRAGAAFRDLDQKLDRAIDLEGVVLRNALAGSQPAGKVEVGDEFVTVGGVKVKREARRP